MKVLKTIGLVVVGLIVLVLVLGLIAPREFEVERTTSINSSPEQVYAVVSDLNTWDQWSVWAQNDSTMVITPGEKMQGEGASYSWTSEESGDGEQTILSVEENRRIETLIDFGSMGEANGFWAFEPAGESTSVTWGFKSKMPYPMNAMMIFYDMDEAVGKDFEQGLANLKELLESRPAQPAAMEASLQTGEARYFLTSRHQVAITELEKVYGEALPALLEAMQKAGIEPISMPTGLYYNWDEEKGTTDVAAAFQVAEPKELAGYELVTIAGGEEMIINHYGGYSSLGDAHMAMDAAMAKHGKQARMPVMETYVTDPGQEPDSTKWLTQIIYPVQ